MNRELLQQALNMIDKLIWALEKHLYIKAPCDAEPLMEALRQELAKSEQDRESDRKRFPDEAFNRWLDEGVSDSGHTVWDMIGNIFDAWAAWENRPFYGKQDHGFDRTASHMAGEYVDTAEQEPVAWYRPSKDGYDSGFRDHSTVMTCTGRDWSDFIPLYTSPPRKEWVGLTDDEIKNILDCGRGGLIDIKKAEAKLKEKNA